MNSGTDTPQLRRTLGLFDGIAILIGITIGAGIYSTPQIIAEYQPSFPQIIGLWCLAGLFVLLGGLVHAELGSRMPHTGGEYVYISRAFGPTAGFLFGWAQLIIIRTSPAAGLAIITVDYFEHFVTLPGHAARLALAAAIIIAVGVINYIGIRQASRYQNISSVIKVLGLFGLVAAGLFLVDGQGAFTERVPVDSPRSRMELLGATMMLIVFSFLGWDRVGYSAGEMRDPKRTIPRSILIGIGVVLLVYLGANLLYHNVLGMQGVRGSKRVASAAATELFGPIGAAIVAIVVMVSATGSINGTMMTAPRVYFVMARDGLFFRWFDYVHPTFRTPSRAIVAHCAWSIVILLVRGNFENIVSGMVFAVLIFYVVITAAFFRLRSRQAGGSEVLQVPLAVPWVFLAGLVTLIGVRGYYQWETSLVDLTFVASGIPFALYFCRGSGPLQTDIDESVPTAE